MALRLVSAPVGPVISLDEAKGHLGVLHNDDDTLIEGFIDAATGILDGSPGELNRALVAQQWEYAPERGFPSCVVGGGLGAEIYLPLAPVISVDEITYVDPSGLARTLPSSNWTAQIGDRPLIYPNTAWPGAIGRPGAVKIKFTAGYGTAGDVPAALRVAIKMLVAEFYANRGDEAVSSLPTPVARLISPFRHWPG